MIWWFEKFRINSFKKILCPSHYLSALGLSWDAALKITKINLELIIDPKMYIFFEEGIRGGISYIAIDGVKTAINTWNLLTQNKN